MDFLLDTLYQKIIRNLSVLYNEAYATEKGATDIDRLKEVTTNTRKDIKVTLNQISPFVRLEGDDLTIVNIFVKFYGEADIRT